MRIIINLIITALIVYLLANFMPGISVSSFGTSIIVVIVLALLNLIVKPILSIISIPITVFTLGLFLFVINAIIILICGYLVDGFHVESFWYALLFSLLLSLVQSIVGGIMTTNK